MNFGWCFHELLHFGPPYLTFTLKSQFLIQRMFSLVGVFKTLKHFKLQYLKS